MKNKDYHIEEVIMAYNDLCALYELYSQIYEIYTMMYLDLKEYAKAMQRYYKGKNKEFKDYIVVLKIHKLMFHIKKINRLGEDGKYIIHCISESLSKGKSVSREEQNNRYKIIETAFINFGNLLDKFYYIRNKYGHMLDKSKMYYGVMDSIKRSYLKLKEF